ncbi:MAG: HAD family phosphatase [Clostridium sp.]|nr:HAD family phosphatase [Bacteroides sp.]MCM1199377.1 HAD family phosphatase [Clostridium sp.]
MIKNIIFDFGGVLLDWNPHYVFDPYFGNTEKAQWFIDNICTPQWNAALDAGKPFSEGVKELIAVHPEWEKEIRMYHTEWLKMMGGQIEGMYEIVKGLKDNGYRLFGLTNWAAETFALVRDTYPVLSLLEGIVVSGEEKMIKPDPEIYRILLDRYGLKAEECVFIDDTLRNTKAAEALGIKGIHLTSKDQLTKALKEIL